MSYEMEDSNFGRQILGFLHVLSQMKSLVEQLEKEDCPNKRTVLVNEYNRLGRILYGKEWHVTKKDIKKVW